MTTVRGQALNVAKLQDGTQDTNSISNGDHDFLAKKQNHTTKNWYPSDEYRQLEHMGRRKLFINQETQKQSNLL